MKRAQATACLFVCFRVSICLRITSISVPALKSRGEPATLSCEYDLEGGKLYSVKWYRDNEEFYRYMPRLRPPQHAHTLDGVVVDLHKSSARRVHLRELTLRSRGLYRCEVSEEAPSFHSAQTESFMEILVFPREAPKISGQERLYSLNERLDLNCSSGMSFPAPELQWHVNGKRVIDKTMLTPYEPTPAGQGLLVSTLGLSAPAQIKMRLRCTAIIGTHRRERTIYLEVNSSFRRRSSTSLLLLPLTITSFRYFNSWLRTS